MIMKFTEKIKQDWLAALKSGKYKQGFEELYNSKEGTHCCIGVLGEVVEGLDNTVFSGFGTGKSPYEFLENSLGEKEVARIWMTNDEGKQNTTDYSNVIPLIESLPV